MISTYGNLRSKIKSSKANRNAINAKTVKASKQFVLKNLALKKKFRKLVGKLNSISNRVLSSLQFSIKF